MAYEKAQFIRDKARGEKGERKVQRYILEKFNIKTEAGESKKEYTDLKVLEFEKQNVTKEKFNEFINKYGYTIQVKVDDTAIRTGNIYLEIWSDAKSFVPGAILECKADSLWYVVGDKFLVFNRAMLLSWLITYLFCNSENADEWRKVTGEKSWAKSSIRTYIKEHDSYIDKLNPEIFFMPASTNPDVRGLIIPIKDIEKLDNKIGLIEVIEV